MRGLSCYTASLHDYLAGEWDAAALLSRSVRLAVRVDLPGGELAFSHHEPSLDRLPDGSWLRYASVDHAAGLRQVERDMRDYGRVIVMADSARLPWSVTRGGSPAPHWLLLDGKDGGEWHATDGFTALLPEGEQRPYQGALSTEALIEAMTLPARWTPEQQARNALAFGAPVPVPPSKLLWLHRSEDRGGQSASEGCWLAGNARVLEFLTGFLATDSVTGERYLDDIWAAAGHCSFAYRWRLAHEQADAEQRQALEQAATRWEDLPRVLRIAVLSAQRGRPRPTLVRAALDELIRAEENVSARRTIPPHK